MSPTRAKLLGLVVYAVYCLLALSAAPARGDDTFGGGKPPGDAAAPPSLSIPLGPGTQVHIEDRTTTTETAGGTGIGVSASGDKAKADGLKTDAPEAKLPGGQGASGGGGSLDGLSAFSNPSWAGWRVLLGLLGLALIAAGAAGVKWLDWPARAMLECGALGVLCILTACFPSFMFIAAIVLAVGALVFYLVATHGGAKARAEAAKMKEALRAVVAGVSAAPGDVQAIVKGEIEKQADHVDKAVIGEIKRADGLR